MNSIPLLGNKKITISECETTIQGRIVDPWEFIELLGNNNIFALEVNGYDILWAWLETGWLSKQYHQSAMAALKKSEGKMNQDLSLKDITLLTIIRELLEQVDSGQCSNNMFVDEGRKLIMLNAHKLPSLPSAKNSNLGLLLA
jgi:hypothetical protein